VRPGFFEYPYHIRSQQIGNLFPFDHIFDPYYHALVLTKIDALQQCSSFEATYLCFTEISQPKARRLSASQSIILLCAPLPVGMHNFFA
jgi:hypothetical protein